MSHSNDVVVKTEEETTTLHRDVLPIDAKPTRAIRLRRMKAAAYPIKAEEMSDNDTASTITESDTSQGSSRKRRGDASEEESEKRPSKRRLSEQVIIQLEEEEVLQSLLEGCDEPVEPSFEVKVEPVPEISLTLWRINASTATQRTRARAPSPPESTTQVEENFFPVTPPWSPEPSQVAAEDREDGVLVGGRLLRITHARRQRLGLPPLEVPVVPRVVAGARKNAAATKRKPAKGRKSATK